MDKNWWTFTNLSAAVFRQNIKTALLATGIDPTDEAVGYIARPVTIAGEVKEG